MPIRFTYDQQRAILFTTAEGLVTLAEIESHLDQESKARALGCPEIFDASTATTNLTSDDVRSLVRQLLVHKANTHFGPTAFIATNDLLFGMARMISIVSELHGGPKIEVFRTLDAALGWLGHEAPAGPCEPVDA